MSLQLTPPTPQTTYTSISMALFTHVRLRVSLLGPYYPLDIFLFSPGPFMIDVICLTLLPLKGTYSHDEDHDSHGAAARIPDDRIFGAIFACLQHIFDRIKPRKLLFIAVDGVAPRAKMKEQRSRRFRVAQEAREKAERLGLGERQEGVFDPNSISPGGVSLYPLNIFCQRL